MKKLILVSCLLFIGLSVFTPNVFAKYNLMQPEEKSIEINGEVYNFLLYKYDPPYLVPQYYFKDKSEQNLSTPEETRIAITSAFGRDSEWYLSLFDESGKKKMLEINKKTNGEYLEEYLSGEPYRDAKKEGSYSELLYKIEFKYDDQLYTVIYQYSYMDGDRISETGGNYEIYIKKQDKWLRIIDKDIEEYPLVWLAGLHSYSQLQELCQKGYWYAPGAKKPVRLKVITISNKKEYEYKKPIIFNVKIENIWREDVTIYTRFKPLGESVRFTIKSQQNNIDHEDSIITDIKPTKEDFTILKPGDYKEITYERTEYLKDVNPYLISDKCIIDEAGTAYYPPGEYTVKVRYSTLGVDNKNCIIPQEGLGWYSEPITIKVLPSEEYNMMIEEKNNPSISEEELAIEEALFSQPKADRQVKIYLKNGRVVKGRIIREDKDTVDVRRDFVDNYFIIPVNKADIERIE